MSDISLKTRGSIYPQIKQMCKLSGGGFHFTALHVVEDNDAVICTLCSALIYKLYLHSLIYMCAILLHFNAKVLYI